MTPRKFLQLRASQALESNKRWIRALRQGCRTLFILALHFKAVLKTRSGRHVWTTKGFYPLQVFPKRSIACAKLFKHLKEK